MARPRVLLIPEFTEIEWTIRPTLEEWADVASYDPPGVGEEPPPDADEQAVPGGWRRAAVLRGLRELDDRGWDSAFLVADGYACATAAGIAAARPDAIAGVALSHACLSYRKEGERAPLNREVFAAMRQLIRQDHREFITHGLVQMTQGGYSEELVTRMLERIPSAEMMERLWDALVEDQEPFGEPLRRLNCPILLARHEGCIAFTPEGFEEAAGALPEARTTAVPDPPTASSDFAADLREFCLEAASPEPLRESAEPR